MAEANGSEDSRAEGELRTRLRAVEAEYAELLAQTMGRSTVGNPELVGRSKELEREADDLRVRLGESPLNPPAPSRRSAISGWLILFGSIVAILALVLLLPH